MGMFDLYSIWICQIIKCGQTDRQGKCNRRVFVTFNLHCAGLRNEIQVGMLKCSEMNINASLRPMDFKDF